MSEDDSAMEKNKERIEGEKGSNFKQKSQAMLEKVTYKQRSEQISMYLPLLHAISSCPPSP